MIFKERICKYCKAKYQPEKPKQIVCSAECAIAYSEKQRTKQLHTQARMERKALREKKQALKTRQQWFDECKEIAQRYARVRDRFEGCISCEKPPNWHGQWHGSHFRPAGNYKAVALNLWNIHKACSECNKFKSGNLVTYQDRLILKIGREKVDWLKSQTQPHKHTIEYLKRYKQVVGARLKIIEKRSLCN